MCVRRAIRVLQVVYSLNLGGVETWLMHILRNIDRTQFQLDFVTFSDSPGSYAEEAEQLGSKIFSCPPVKQPMRHSRQFSKILRQHGPYDVVHSHDPTWSGSVLSIARRLGVPVRIVHSHNDIRRLRPRGLFKNLYYRLSVTRSRNSATHGFACSALAAKSYFGSEWQIDPRWHILFCGEDFSAFHESVATNDIREALGFPKGSFIIGHVGSFGDRRKNHRFLVDVAKEIVDKDPSTYFLLVGDGILRMEIEDLVRQAGMDERFRFAGVRFDVAQLMLGAMDMFLFPSLFEGLGLVLVEAQAAGLPCVCSDVIPEEADVVPELITRISLAKSPAEWARAILETRNARRRISQAEALGRVENGPFNLSKSIEQLEEVYSCKPPKAKLARDRLERK